jgi:hypothetical protein
MISVLNHQLWLFVVCNFGPFSLNIKSHCRWQSLFFLKNMTDSICVPAQKVAIARTKQPRVRFCIIHRLCKQRAVVTSYLCLWLRLIYINKCGRQNASNNIQSNLIIISHCYLGSTCLCSLASAITVKIVILYNVVTAKTPF